MWVAELADGSMAGGPDANFLAISQPISKLAVFNTDIVIKDCSHYYMVYHAVAAAGQQGRVEAIEIGGLTKGGEYQGINVTKFGVKTRKAYTAANFPYGASLKPGSKE